MPIELRKPDRPEDWESFHGIRRAVLFEGRALFGVYDDDHPDDRAATNHPMLLLEDGRPLGVVRLDLLGQGRAGVRLVAIAPTSQRRGLGRAMMGLVERYAAARGVTVLELNAAPAAVGFYRRLGWTVIDPDRSEPLMERRL